MAHVQPASPQWEKALLEEMMQEDEFVGWLRNIPRKEWALCIPLRAKRHGKLSLWTRINIGSRHGHLKTLEMCSYLTLTFGSVREENGAQEILGEPTFRTRCTGRVDNHPLRSFGDLHRSVR